MRPEAVLVPPVIFSPLTKVPVISPTLNVGATASVASTSESYTAWSLNTSPLPKDIVLSVGLVP